MKFIFSVIWFNFGCISCFHFLYIFCEIRNTEMANGVVFCHGRLQTACDHYRAIADEAYHLLTDVGNRGVLSQSQAGQLGDWLELVEEVCCSLLL